MCVDVLFVLISIYIHTSIDLHGTCYIVMYMLMHYNLSTDLVYKPFAEVMRGVVDKWNGSQVVALAWANVCFCSLPTLGP